METSDESSSNVENGKRKFYSYHHPSGHSNKDCNQQQSDKKNLGNKKRWRTYHNSASHSNNESAIKEIVNIRTVPLFILKIVGNKKPSLLMLPYWLQCKGLL